MRKVVPRRTVDMFVFWCIAKPMGFLYRLLFSTYEYNSAVRRGNEFVAEIQERMGHLLAEFGGEVQVVWPKQIPAPFGYQLAEAGFPDRKLSFVRGRSEFYATLEANGKERIFFSTSMPSAFGDGGKDGGALSRCVKLLQEHWAELPFASDAEITRFDMQSRVSRPMFRLIADE